MMIPQGGRWVEAVIWSVVIRKGSLDYFSKETKGI